MADLSILIPARNEMFLAKTIEDILQNIRGKTEIIAVLDGAWADPPVADDDRVTLIYNPQSIGQRAATNQAARASTAKYLMKSDAHCSFDEGFDVKMMAEMHDDWTMAPLMKNLHAFDWVCEGGHRRYQGPSGPCLECGKETIREIVWKAKKSPNSASFCFDPSPHFQYFSEYSKRPEGQGDITESMSLQGSCWMLTRKKYWELDICDESFGSWGSQGIEVAAKTWLSGGRVMVNKKTWYAHLFRTQGGDFSFPYPMSGRDQERAKQYARNLFFGNNWPKQIYPTSWLIEKFWPVKGWTDKDLEKLKKKESPGEKADKKDSPKKISGLPDTGIIYLANPKKEIIFYTDNQLKVKIAHMVQRNLKNIGKQLDIPIISSSLKPMPHFGTKNICLSRLPRGRLTMFKQILAALEESSAEIIYFCEHDCLYHPSNFDFTPPKKDIYYYNQNWWRIRTSDGFALHWDANQVSGLSARRKLLLKFYRERVSEVEKNGYRNSMGYEPGGRNTDRTIAWKSKVPYIDIRHGHNLSKNKWSLKDFRDKSTSKSFTTAYEIPNWGKTAEIIKRF